MKNFRIIFAVGFIIAAGLLFFIYPKKDNPIDITESSEQNSKISSHIDISSSQIEVVQQVVGKKENLKQVSLASKFAELAASKLPRDQFASYLILNDCVKNEQRLKELNIRSLTPENEEEKKMLLSETQKQVRECDGITFTQKSRRLDHLEVAMKAGVKGSATAFFNEGPFGDQEALVNRPNDPSVIDWTHRSIKGLEMAAIAGDKEAFLPLYQLYDGGVLVQRDPYKALIYLTAVYEAKNLEQQKTNVTKPSSMTSLEKALGASEAKEAIGKGNELAKHCCSKN